MLDLAPELTARLHYYEKHMVNDRTERAIVMDFDGKVLLDKADNAYSVLFPPHIHYMVKDNIVTHNHPPGSMPAFSLGDLHLIVSLDPFEFRMVKKEFYKNGDTVDIRKYAHRLQRPNNGWPSHDSMVSIYESWKGAVEALHSIGMNGEALRDAFMASTKLIFTAAGLYYALEEIPV